MKIFRFNKIALNAVWMMSEKIISIFGLIFVTSSVAKYVGPNLLDKLLYLYRFSKSCKLSHKWGDNNI